MEDTLIFDIAKNIEQMEQVEIQQRNDWIEEKRWNYAGLAMQGMLSNPDNSGSPYQTIVEMAVNYSELLVSQLLKK